MTEALEVELTVPCVAWTAALPRARALARRAARAAFAAAGGAPAPAEVSLVLADDAFARRLNRRYRGIDRPTNVLSFSALDASDSAADPLPAMLGDIVVAFEATAVEAARDGRDLGDHLSHLVVHGMLHLLGHDHDDEAEALEMERLEVRILAALGITSPYPDLAP